MRRRYLLYFILLILATIYLGRIIEPVQDFQDDGQKDVSEIQYARHEFNEQEEFFNKLKGMESSDTELVLEKEKKIGEIKYPIRDRDTAVDCRNNKLTKLPAKLNQFIFSGCEEVTIDNWSGNYVSTSYDEIWDYEIRTTRHQNMFPDEQRYKIIQRAQVYWKRDRFVLEILLYANGNVNVVRDRIYFDKSKDL